MKKTFRFHAPRVDLQLWQPERTSTKVKTRSQKSPPQSGTRSVFRLSFHLFSRIDATGGFRFPRRAMSRSWRAVQRRLHLAEHPGAPAALPGKHRVLKAPSSDPHGTCPCFSANVPANQQRGEMSTQKSQHVWTCSSSWILVKPQNVLVACLRLHEECCVRPAKHQTTGFLEGSLTVLGERDCQVNTCHMTSFSVEEQREQQKQATTCDTQKATRTTG